MKKQWLAAGLAGLVLFLGAVSMALAQSGVSLEAKDVFQKMCDHLKSKAQFSYRAAVTYDGIEDDGSKLTHSFEAKMFVRRPDRLRVDAAGDQVNKNFFFNGTTITLHDKTDNVYGVLDAPADIEGALDRAHKDFDLRVALADLASPKLGALLLGESDSAKYLGKERIRGVSCHHLEFVREDLQFQLWVDAGKVPLLHKLVIMRKDGSEITQWTAVFSHWDFTSKLKDNIFIFVVPKDAQKINFVPAEKGAKQ